MVNTPYGGKLVEREAGEKEAARLLSQAGEMPCIEIDHRILSDVEMLATGAFSPLEGFMGKEEFESVLEKTRLPDGLPWSIPIVLPASREQAESAKGESVTLAFKGKPVAVVMVEEAFPHDIPRHAEKVYLTKDASHPGVKALKGEFLLSGKVTLLEKPEVPFRHSFLSPREVRAEFSKRKWKRIVAFQTRNAPHRAHEYLQKKALEEVDGLFIHPVIGERKEGDAPPETILGCYRVLIEKYHPQGRVFLSALPIAMRYAGPREAIWHAIIRRNYGATHFIIGRDHAGVGNYYGPFDAQKAVSELKDELGVEPFFFKNAFYCTECNDVASEDACAHPKEKRLDFSGTMIRNAISSGGAVDERILRPEIAAIMRQTMELKS